MALKKLRPNVAVTAIAGVGLCLLASTILSNGAFLKQQQSTAQQEQAIGYFWENSEMCFAVEDICLDRQGRRWVYFSDSRKNGTHQPSISLDFLLIKNENPSVIDTSIMHFGVSPIYKRTLEDLGQQLKCEMSNLENHIVLQSDYNGMLGEFYLKSFAPLVGLITEDLVAPASSQYYIHFGLDEALLESHTLFLNLLSSQSIGKNFKEMFLPDGNIGCECFPRLVFCGYTQSQPEANTTCLSRFGSLRARHPRISSELCDLGLGVDIMQSVVQNEGREGLRELLHEVSNGALFNATKEIMQFVDRQSQNLAIGADFEASSEDPLHPARNAFDGTSMTRWASDNTDSEYIQVDLSVSFNVTCVIARWEHAAAKQYEIQVSSDGKHFETVWAKLNGFSGMGEVESTFNGTECRFVRLQGTERASQWGFSLYEMEVYGTNSEKKKERGLTHSVDWSELSKQVTLVLASEMEVHGNVNDPMDKFFTTRSYILRNLGSVFPNLKREVAEYRRTLLNQYSVFDTDDDWKLIGLTQRLKRRSWLNIDEIIGHCNRKYKSMKMLCVEVNVEKLPSGRGNFDPSYEQVLLHQSLAGLIGVHGAQLTQGLLLPENSTLVELLPWVPTNNYFPSGHDAWGIWTQSTHEPTPVGFMFHNTDLHHYGFILGRDSVPLCQNATNNEMHKFEEEDDLPDNHEAVSELEHCLFTLHEEEFRWDNRNFVVGREMMDGLMTFYPGSTQLTNDTCDMLKQRGERSGFVLYNTWCREKPDGVPSLHHFYTVTRS